MNQSRTRITNTPFDNMMAQFVYQGKFLEENVAIKHVWQKGRAVFLDLYFYRTQTSKLIDTSFVKSLSDIKTDKTYTNMIKFVNDYFAIMGSVDEIHPPKDEPITAEITEPESTNILVDYKNELTILYFMLKCNPVFLDVKFRAICDYIASKINQSNNTCSSFVRTYLKYLKPEEADFYQAAGNMAKKPPEEALELLKQALKIGISDGGLNYSERIYLSELVQIYRENNINVDIEF